jgi:hypothetical protein
MSLVVLLLHEVVLSNIFTESQTINLILVWNIFSVPLIMRKYSSLLGSSGMAMGLTTAAIAIAVILLSSSFTLINAQSQQVTGQDGEIENGTTTTATTFQSTNDDSFSIQVPQGWVIQDVNNTGPVLLEERTQGYAILAQLCPEEQQRPVPPNASISSTTSCQGAQDVIHIIRYPDLDTRLSANNVTTTNNTITTIDNILTYHLQKLQEVGYRSMQIVNSTDVTSDVRNLETDETITTEPAKFVEIRYSTNATPDETRRGYFVLTATDITTPNLGATKGYSVFYEGNTTSTTTAAEITTAAASLPPPPSIAQVFDSFELIAAAEAAEDVDDDDDNGDDDNGEDEKGEDGDGDDDNGDDDNGDDDNGDDDNGDDNDDNGDDNDDNGDDNDDNGDDNDDNGDDNNNGISDEELEQLCEVSPGGNLRDDCDLISDA